MLHRMVNRPKRRENVARFFVVNRHQNGRARFGFHGFFMTVFTDPETVSAAGEHEKAEKGYPKIGGDPAEKDGKKRDHGAMPEFGFVLDKNEMQGGAAISGRKNRKS